MFFVAHAKNNFQFSIAIVATIIFLNMETANCRLISNAAALGSQACFVRNGVENVTAISHFQKNAIAAEEIVV